MPPKASEILHWDEWNSKYRQWDALDDEPSKRRMREVLASLGALQIGDAKILEVGCGTGWLSAKLAKYGTVTAVDLGVEIIQNAAKKMPEIDFRSGDICELDLPANHFDVVVVVETLSHVVNQEQFIERIAHLLKQGGALILTTQNKFIFDRCNVAPNVGYRRQWVTMRRLKQLLNPKFFITRATSLEPQGHQGILRITNSSRLNRLIAAVFGEGRIKRLKEDAGLGQTLFAVAVRR
jgi:2-polyprenyl-3-methyl-5-hydroxy-6-metoxy-1,4-benzoquinol methylase